MASKNSPKLKSALKQTTTAQGNSPLVDVSNRPRPQLSLGDELRKQIEARRRSGVGITTTSENVVTSAVLAEPIVVAPVSSPNQSNVQLQRSIIKHALKSPLRRQIEARRLCKPTEQQLATEKSTEDIENSSVLLTNDANMASSQPNSCSHTNKGEKPVRRMLSDLLKHDIERRRRQSNGNVASKSPLKASNSSLKSPSVRKMRTPLRRAIEEARLKLLSHNTAALSNSNDNDDNIRSCGMGAVNTVVTTNDTDDDNNHNKQTRKVLRLSLKRSIESRRRLSNDRAASTVTATSPSRTASAAFSGGKHNLSLRSAIKREIEKRRKSLQQNTKPDSENEFAIVTVNASGPSEVPKQEEEQEEQVQEQLPVIPDLEGEEARLEEEVVYDNNVGIDTNIEDMDSEEGEFVLRTVSVKSLGPAALHQSHGSELNLGATLRSLFRVPREFLSAMDDDYDEEIVCELAELLAIEQGLGEAAAYDAALDAFLEDPVDVRVRVGGLAVRVDEDVSVVVDHVDIDMDEYVRMDADSQAEQEQEQVEDSVHSLPLHSFKADMDDMSSLAVTSIQAKAAEKKPSSAMSSTRKKRSLETEDRPLNGDVIDQPSTKAATPVTHVYVGAPVSTIKGRKSSAKKRRSAVKEEAISANCTAVMSPFILSAEPETSRVIVQIEPSQMIGNECMVDMAVEKESAPALEIVREPSEVLSVGFPPSDTANEISPIALEVPSQSCNESTPTKSSQRSNTIKTTPIGSACRSAVKQKTTVRKDKSCRHSTSNSEAIEAVTVVVDGSNMTVAASPITERATICISDMLANEKESIAVFDALPVFEATSEPVMLLADITTATATLTSSVMVPGTPSSRQPTVSEPASTSVVRKSTARKSKSRRNSVDHSESVEAATVVLDSSDSIEAASSEHTSIVAEASQSETQLITEETNTFDTNLVIGGDTGSESVIEMAIETAEIERVSIEEVTSVAAVLLSPHQPLLPPIPSTNSEQDQKQGKVAIAAAAESCMMTIDTDIAVTATPVTTNIVNTPCKSSQSGISVKNTPAAITGASISARRSAAKQKSTVRKDKSRRNSVDNSSVVIATAFDVSIAMMEVTDPSLESSESVTAAPTSFIVSASVPETSQSESLTISPEAMNLVSENEAATEVAIVVDEVPTLETVDELGNTILDDVFTVKGVTDTFEDSVHDSMIAPVEESAAPLCVHVHVEQAAMTSTRTSTPAAPYSSVKRSARKQSEPDTKTPAHASAPVCDVALNNLKAPESIPVVASAAGSKRGRSNGNLVEKKAIGTDFEEEKEKPLPPKNKRSRETKDNKVTPSQPKGRGQAKAPINEPDDWEDAMVIICDGCDSEFFMDDIGMTIAPEGDWFCNPCTNKCDAKSRPKATRGKKATATTDSTARRSTRGNKK